MLRRGCAAVCGLIALVAICGCRRPADRAPSPIVELTAASFQREVIESQQPVLVEFWAPWCRPCVEMMPAMQQVADDFSGRATIARLRIDEHQELADEFDVEAPPAILVFHHGRIVKRRSGLQSAENLAELLTAVLDGAQPRSSPQQRP